MVTFGTRRVLVLSLLISWSLAPSAYASQPPAGFRRIRVLSPCLDTLIETAAAASPTVRALVARVNGSDLIVYVRCVVFRNAALYGRLMFLTAAAGQRYLVIELRVPEQWASQVATVAHELQHAVEVADASWVRSQATLAMYYQQRGITMGTTPLVFDTDAARQVGLRVQRELSAMTSAAEPANK